MSIFMYSLLPSSVSLFLSLSASPFPSFQWLTHSRGYNAVTPCQFSCIPLTLPLSLSSCLSLLPSFLCTTFPFSMYIFYSLFTDLCGRTTELSHFCGILQESFIIIIINIMFQILEKREKRNRKSTSISHCNIISITYLLLSQLFWLL